MTANGEWHNVNKLYGAPPGKSGGLAKSLHTSLGRGRYGLINNIIVYDHWYTTLSAPDSFWIGGAGGDVLDYISVESYGEDWFETLHLMNYTLSRYTIPENLDDYEKTWTITVTQVDTGILITIICTQGPVEWTTEYALSMSPTTLPASGGYTYPTVYIYTYRNGKYYDYDTTSPTAMNGYSVDGNNHVLSSTWLYIRSAGTDWYTYTRTAYVINSYTFKYSGESITKSTYVSIYQSPNTKEYTTLYSVTMDGASVSEMGAEGGTFTVKAYCLEAPGYKYASGDSEVSGSWSDSTAYVYGSNADVSPSTFTGETTITATVDENESTSSRNVIITVVSSGDTGERAQRTVPQNGATYYLTDVNGSTATKELSAAYNQSTVTCSVFSRMNSSTPVEIIPSDVSINTSISGVTVDSVVPSSIPAYQYNINIYIGTNPDKTTRTATVTVTKNGKTMTFNITQAAEQSSVPSGMAEWASDGEWHLGTVPTGETTGSPNYIPAHMLIVAKDSEISSDATATYSFTYKTTKPDSDSSGTVEEEHSKTGSSLIPSGSSITINGTEYYGVQILSGTGLGYVTINSFDVS